MTADINFLAIFVAAIVIMVIGAIWYSQAAFGKEWMKAMGKSEAEMEKAKADATRSYISTFIGAILMALVLEIFIGYRGVISLLDGALVGFLAWLGFVLPSALGSFLFEGRNKKLFLINAGYNGVALIIIGAILALW